MIVHEFYLTDDSTQWFIIRDDGEKYSLRGYFSEAEALQALELLSLKEKDVS